MEQTVQVDHFSTQQVFLQEIPLFSWLFRWNSCRTCSGSPETKGLLTYWLFIEVWSNSLEKFDRQEFPSGSEILRLIVRMSYLLLPHFLTCKMGSRHYFTCAFSEIHPMPHVRTSGTTSWKESPTEVQKNTLNIFHSFFSCPPFTMGNKQIIKMMASGRHFTSTKIVYIRKEKNLGWAVENRSSFNFLKNIINETDIADILSTTTCLLACDNSP